MRYFLRSLLLVIIVVFEAAVMFWSRKTLILLIVAGPAFINLTVCSFASIIFRELEKIPGTVSGKEDFSDKDGTE